ncbi:MAG TPA: carboxypeptidase-like regulatory domain-containing protein [Terriglobia bacterium]|nr:carboxypeptidase-like regulatory domain-containing protein [Terriglobia bacterium]
MARWLAVLPFLLLPQTHEIFEGRVVHAGTVESSPIGNATIELNGASQTIITKTDDNGYFRHDVPTGQYKITITAAGYMAGPLPERGMSGPGSLVTVAEATKLGPFLFKLAPTGTIAGIVRDHDNEPLAGILVQALKARYAGDRYVLSPIAFARTDDRGEYRLYWLTPDEYVVSATYAALSANGPRFVPANPNIAPPPSGYLPTFFPGVTDVLQAREILLKAGETLSNVDFQFRPNPVVSISGKVTDVRTGRGVPAQVRLIGRDRVVVDGVWFDVQAATSGEYRLSDVPPGKYVLSATLRSGDPMSTFQLLDVMDKEIKNADLLLDSGVTLSGRIIQDGPVANLTKVTITLVATPFPVSVQLESASVQPDTTFQILHVPRGTYQVRVAGVSGDAYVKEIRFAGRELMDSTIAINEPPGDTLDILLSSSGGRLTGKVTDSNNSSYPAAQVVLIPEPRLRNNPLNYKRVTADQNGDFAVRGIAPGRYTLLALPFIEGAEHLNPKFIQGYEAGLEIDVQPGRDIAIRLAIAAQTQ